MMKGFVHFSGLKFVVATAALGAAVLALAGAAGADGRYSDALGDGNGAPDVHGVRVTSDANGQIKFEVTVDNLPGPPADVSTILAVDMDLDESTGAPDWLGADFAFQVDQATQSYGFAHWNGSAWDTSIPSGTVTIQETSTVLTISVNRSELGDTGEFNYWVETRSGDPQLNRYDDAPDAGNWNYSLAVNGPEIKSIVYTPRPKTPRHGRAFTVKLAGILVANDPGLGVPLPPGSKAITFPDSYRCKARLGGRVLRGRGAGGCTWTIPTKKSRGKKLLVTVTVNYDGATKSFRYAFKVT